MPAGLADLPDDYAVRLRQVVALVTMVSISRLPRRSLFRPQRPHWQLVLVVGGQLEVLAAHRELAVCAGESFLVPPGTAHRQRPLQAPGEMACLDFELLLPTGERDPLRQLDCPQAVPLMHPTVCRGAFDAIAACLGDRRGEGGRWRWQSAAHRSWSQVPAMQLLFSHLAAGFAAGIYRTTPVLPAWLHDLLQVLSQRLFDPDLRLRDIIALAGCPASTLNRAFRTHLGTTPMRWLRRERLLLARRQLAHRPDADLTTIARACGFRDRSVFSRHYRRAFGLPPSVGR